ncbi:hydroxymethylbilane synthase [Spirillospora sp. CA-128828]|uniref:hydroxymethylbilane synthase n=1 Tax=Spirillospora sp. CA-128828 TaxID=3240033 RepID=UPI003D8D24E4
MPGLGPVPDEGHVRLGTRRSPLAMAQARHVADLLEKQAPVAVEIVGIETSGDRFQGSLSEQGGKGAFLREIDHALLTGTVDLAVHCLKDVPGNVPPPEGLAWPAYLERDDTRDVMLFPMTSGITGMADLPSGARVGTSAVRRRAQLRRLRPDLRVEHLRGNVNSRLARLDAGGEFHAIVLAHVGLARLGLERPYETLDMLPAVGAGVLAIASRSADLRLTELLGRLDHARTRTCVAAERRMLFELNGDCDSPIAGRARYEPDGRLSLEGMVFDRDGDRSVHFQMQAAPEQAESLGASVAADLLRQGARDLIG